MSEYILGSHPQERFSWQIGKTTYSIDFVRDAEIFISTCNEISKTAQLRYAINRIKDGHMVLTAPLSPEDYLNDPNL